MTFRIVVHGGAASNSADSDGPQEAARRGMDVMKRGRSPLDAVCDAVAYMEDDPRFNAGTGSNLRFDGKTIEMDASVMDSDGRFGGVTLLRDVKNPVLVARAVLRTPHNVVGGEGATRFARMLGHKPHNPWTPRAQQKYDLLMAALRAQKIDPADMPWRMDELKQAWNYEVALETLLGSRDTVGAVATDGERFAASLSTGGLISALMGRIGDVPLPGCGLYAGKVGAVATTGDGDQITRAFLATRVYQWLEQGATPAEARDRALELMTPAVDVGIIIVSKSGHAGGSNRDMAWAALEEE